MRATGASLNFPSARGAGCKMIIEFLKNNEELPLETSYVLYDTSYLPPIRTIPTKSVIFGPNVVRQVNIFLYFSVPMGIKNWPMYYSISSYLEFPKRELLRSGITEIPVGSPGSKSALSWDFPGIHIQRGFICTQRG